MGRNAKLTVALGLALTLATVAGSVAFLASLGTAFAWSLVGAVVLFVATTWAQAAAFERRGAPGYAATLVWFTLFASAVFLAFASHAEELSAASR